MNQNLKNKKIFCIIPAFNEEKKIAQTIKSVIPFVNKVIIINDASIDQTKNILDQLQKKFPLQITILNHLTNCGQGASLATGNTYAQSQNADIIIHFDADGQHRTCDIAPLIKPILNDEADIVFGSRFQELKSKMPFFKKNIIMPIARCINKIFFDINLTDPQSGMRAMNKKALTEIKINQSGMAHCTEIIYASHKKNLKIKEVPIQVIYHEFGQGLKGGLRIIKDFILGSLVR